MGKVGIGRGGIETASLFLSPDDLGVTFGAASATDVTGDVWRGWLVDAGTIEGVGGQVLIPPGWSTVDISIYWCNASIGSGDVSWRCDRGVAAVGVALARDTVGSVVTATAGAQNVLVETTLATGAAVSAGLPLTLSALRIADDVADTLANDATIIGIKISRAS